MARRTSPACRSAGKPAHLEAAPVLDRPRRVALIVETSTLFGRRLLSGIAQYMRENARWSVFFSERAVHDITPTWLAGWHGDGIITRVASPDILPVIAKLRIPAVDLNEQLGSLGMPTISNDHAAIGRLAAMHLLERGFQQFGFVGHPYHPWSDKRQAAFIETVKASGYPCVVYPCRANDMRALCEGTWETEVDSIAAWARQLPHPVGLMGSTDFRALQLLSACALADIAVPEQAAVIGVGGDDVVCDLARPSLSSVVLNAWRTGYEAAATLDRMMQGESIAHREILIPPLDVQVRQSTDITAISDPLVAQAIRFIREHACSDINVESVVQHLSTSRTSLQDHFKRTIHKSVHAVLIENRLKRVKELLATTTLPVAKVALSCGFRHPEYMSSVLKQRTGFTPAAFRRDASGRKAAQGRLPAAYSALQ